MCDWYINAGRAIEELIRQTRVNLTKDERRSLMFVGQYLAAQLRSEHKALARSRRNCERVKRYAHGRTQGTRIHHGQAC